MKKRPYTSSTADAANAWFAFRRVPKLSVLVAVVAVVAFAVWVVPKPRSAVVPADGSPRWASSDGLPQRQIVWQPSIELSSIVPPDRADASLIAPRFADGGTTLYFTLRSEGGQADIYRSRLTHGEWAAAEPVTSLNSVSDDIGAVPSSDGRQLFLYSNRPGGLGGFDVWVSKWQDGDWTPPANVGSPVNSTADEYDPAISPDGRSLYFASNRDGTERLLLSRAEEIRYETAWDTSNLNAISAIWVQALLFTLVVLVMAALCFAARGRFMQAAASVQFIAGSLVFHVLLVFLLTIWNLPKVMEVITSKKFDAEASTQLFDDNQHQSHEDGRAAYEKLADLQSLEDMPQPDVARQETESFSVPERTDSPLPTIPMEVARRLPPERLLFVPPNRKQPQMAATKDVLMPALSRPIPAIAQAVPELEKAAVELPEPVASPGERPIATQIDMPRSELQAPPVQFDIKVPDAMKLRMKSTTDLTPPAVEIGQERMATRLPSSPLAMRVAPVPENTESVELAESIVLPAAPVEAVEKVTVEPTPLMAVDRVSATTPAPVPFATAGERMKTREPQLFVELNAQTSTIENRPADPAKSPILPPRATAPSSISNPLVSTSQIEAEDVRLVAAESSDSTETDQSVESDMKPGLERVESTGPKPLTIQEMSGPASRTQQRIVVGALSPERNNAPPTFNKLASQLDRPLAKAAAVSLAADSVGLRSMFTLRQGDTRKQYIELFGGTEETEKAVNRGLVWLTQHQNADGSWSLNRFHENCNGKHAACNGLGSESSNTAATGLALLPLLAAGNTHVDGEYAKSVAAGLQWLIDHQKPDGELLGPGDSQKMYSQGIAAIAMCEAFGMTQDPNFREPAQRALQYIIDAQNKTTGGWRYTPGEAGDTSVVGWQMMALKSGEMAGLEVPVAVHDGIRRWLKSVEGNKPVGGQLGYINASVTPAMSAEGLLCLQFLGTSRNDPAMRAGADYLLTQLPEIRQTHTSYYWYYGTQVMYHMQGDYWQEWNTALRDMVVETQIKDGHMAGTWNPADNWEHRGGRIYATSMKLLLLEIYYRHLPLYEQLDD